ncbi:magnesium transporter CorA family protein [Limosilactobacillus sp.]|uniref:magnesium transporter CorA family protein n=1 Tax=Limosilactobacillus sp. TaxID=2773925 RepID=UPI00345ECE00
MLKSYRIADRRLRPNDSSLKTATIVIMSNPSKEEQATICRQFDLEPLTFQFCNAPEEVARFHQTPSTVLDHPNLLVLYDFIADRHRIKDQLAPAILIWDQDHLIICTAAAGDSQNLLEEAATDSPTIIELVMTLVNNWQDRLMTALMKYKPEIDKLDRGARKTIENDELRHLTNLIRRLVFFEHTMNDQNDTLAAFLKSPAVEDIDTQVILDTQTKQRRLNKAIHIFRDLLESISGLFTAMMDNNLNHLMKFLDSAALVIAIPALVTGFMGMNVGGLPWKGDPYGFWLTFIISIVIALATAYYLNHKEYTD